MFRLQIILFALLLSVSAVLLALQGHPSNNTQPSRAYLGFDLNYYPGDGALPILRKTFSFSSYWLSPPPGERHTTWLGKRALVQSQGLGFVVLYNGRLSKNLKSAADARRKGTADAENAAKLARQEGFPPGTIVFLDIEEGGRLSTAYHDYVHAWIDALAKADFRSGAYCSGVPIDESGGHSITTVADLLDHLGGRKLTLWIFNDVCPPSPGCVFPSTPPAVAQGGFPVAAVWQFAQSPQRKDRTAKCSATYNADGNCYAPGDAKREWSLDINVANSANPSAPAE
jgi:hypothetical protein